MALSIPIRIDPTSPGYGMFQQVPITGATPPPTGSTPDNQDPPDKPINDWLKSQPWFQAALKAWGVDPNNIHLGLEQRGQIADAAARAGFQFGSSHDIGPDGGFEDTHGTAAKVTILSIAGIAGGVGAAGLMAGAGGAEAGAGAASSGVGLGETGATVGGLSSAALPGAVAAPSLLGGAAAGGAAATGGAATTAGVGGGEVGATTGGLSSSALPGATAAPTVGDLATSSSAIPGTTGAVNSLASNPSTYSRIAQLAGTAGSAINGAAQSAGQTQLTNAQLGLTANQQNISGNSAFENELMNRAKLEQSQRTQAEKDAYRQNYLTNGPISPFNPVGRPATTPAYQTTINNLGNQGSQLLTNPAQYNPNAMPALKPYTTYNPNTMSGPGGTMPSTTQQVAQWLGPTLSTIGAISRIYGGGA